MIIPTPFQEPIMSNGDRGRNTDDAFDALAHFQRRKLLLALLEHNPQDDSPVVTVRDANEANEMQQLIDMEHVHLPKLDDYGFIEWDRDHNEVAKGQNFDEIRPLLELLDGHEDELPDGWL